MLELDKNDAALTLSIGVLVLDSGFCANRIICSTLSRSPPYEAIGRTLRARANQSINTRTHTRTRTAQIGQRVKFNRSQKRLL